MTGAAVATVRSARRSDAPDSVHATALVLGEAGVLIRGPSGSGKSGLALALLALAGHHGLFAALIGDDRVHIRVSGRQILASGAPNVRGLIERRGYGVVRAPIEPCAVMRLVVDLSRGRERNPRLPDDDFRKVSFGEITLPRLAFDAASAPLERAYAILEYLDRIGDKIVSGIAHFA
jgi:serine kinase of HPr protein (carbohydrate metabolism regulator)